MNLRPELHSVMSTHKLNALNATRQGTMLGHAKKISRIRPPTNQSHSNSPEV